MTVITHNLPFGNPATPLRAECYPQGDEKLDDPYIIIHDTNGAPILTLGASGDGYWLTVVPGVSVAEVINPQRQSDG